VSKVTRVACPAGLVLPAFASSVSMAAQANTPQRPTFLTMRILLLLLAGVLAACAPLPQRAGIPTGWLPSPNFDPRRPALVVIHYTSDGSAASALATLTSPSSRVSAHYFIDRDGSIRQLVDENARAWHAGESRWGAMADVNSASIGIELDNDGREGYPPVQMDSLLRLLWDLRQRYRLSPASFLGHSDVAPSRKSDPGPLFPWRLLAAYGFGLWCDPPYLPSPPGFDALLGLRAIGYDVRQPAAALAAFRMRYAPGLPTDEPIERDIDLIHCLAQKSLHQ
jgi:N-acetylmuramoyl-L-alanine amidase